MLSIFSCFGSTSSYARGSTTSETPVAPRQVRNTSLTEKCWETRRNSCKDIEYDEKSPRGSLSDDSEAEMCMKEIDISEKTEEAIVYSDDEANITTSQRRLTRRSIGWRSKKKSGKETMKPMQAHNTGDELHRWAEFERNVKKLSPAEAEKAWAVERARRREWSREKHNAKEE